MQALADGFFASCSVAVSLTGIGAVGSAVLGAGISMFQYYIDTKIRNEDFSMSEFIFAGFVGAVSGIISGAGANHSSSISSNLSPVGKSAQKAIQTATLKYGESGSGTIKTFRLWGKILKRERKIAYFIGFKDACLKMYNYTPILSTLSALYQKGYEVYSEYFI